MKICAIIVTYRRLDWLTRCVFSLQKAAKKNPTIKLEIKILINGPDLKCYQSLKSLPSTNNWGSIHVEMLRDPLLPSEARNKALSGVEADWFFFVDDDAYVDEDHLSRFEETLRKFPHASAIGGPNLTPSHSTWFQKATGLALACPFGTLMSASRYKKLGTTRPCDELSLILCNLFLKQSSQYLEKFPDGMICSEENWLLQLFERQGRIIIYNPELYVWHERRSTLNGFVTQIFNYGFGRGQNVRRSFKLYNFLHFIPSLCLCYLVTTAFLGALSHLRLPYFYNSIFIYLFLSFFFTFYSFYQATETFRTRMSVVFLFPLIHSSYGLGLIFGLLRSNRNESSI